MTAPTWEDRWAMGGWWEDAKLQRKKFPIGPRNTYSNISYALAAVYVVLTGKDSTRWVLGAALFLLAIGSAAYHCFKIHPKNLWNNLDWAGMGSTMSVLDVAALFPRSVGKALGAFTIGTVASLLIAQHMHFDLVMGGMFGAALIPAYLHGNAALATTSLLTFLLAMAFWQMDRKRWVIVGLYGHAAWHVLTAAAMPQLHAAQVR